MKKTTINDIATEAGVSVATVSRFINSSGYVGDDAAEQIDKAIKKLNYIPSQIAINLKKSKSDIIGFLVPDLCNEFFSEVYYGASKVAEANGKHLILINTDEDLKIEKEALKTLLSQQVCGLIMTPVCENDNSNATFLKRAEKNNIPTVFIDREIAGFDFDGVYVDNEAASRKAVSLLIENGHRDIAIIAGPTDTIPGRERFKGYKNALNENGIEVNHNRILQGNFKTADSYDLVKKILSENDRPTAIFSSNNSMTVGAIRAIFDLGLRIPEDIAFIGFDDVEILSSLGINITMIKRATFEMGKVAMNIMLQRINDENNNDYSVQRTVLQSKLIVRGSEKYCKKEEIKKLS